MITEKRQNLANKRQQPETEHEHVRC